MQFARRSPICALLLASFASASTAALELDRTAGQLRYYTGSVLLDGVVERRTDKETLELEGDNLCFTVVGQSRRLIPREGDTRAAWFCFSNRAAALRALRLPIEPGRGTCGYRMPAKVLVGSYVVNRAESEVSDTAALLSVKLRGVLRAIPCK